MAVAIVRIIRISIGLQVIKDKSRPRTSEKPWLLPGLFAEISWLRFTFGLPQSSGGQESVASRPQGKALVSADIDTSCALGILSDQRPGPSFDSEP